MHIPNCLYCRREYGLLVMSLLITVSSPLIAQEGTEQKTAKAPVPQEIQEFEITSLEIPSITPGTPMTLRQTLEAVDKRNFDLRAARVSLEQAQARLKHALGGVLPIISSDLSFQHHDHEDSTNMQIPGAGDLGTIVTMPQQNLKGTLSASVPIIRSSSWLRIVGAKKGVSVANLSIEEIRQQLLHVAAVAYFQALMARHLINLHVTTIETYTEHLKIAHARVNAGSGLRIDVIRAETDRDRAYQQLLASHLTFDNSRDTLRLITGSESLPMPLETAPMAVSNGTITSLESRAVTSHSELKTKRAVISLNETDINATWMQFIPTLDLSWQGSYQFTELGDMGSSDRMRWFLMLQLTVPIYNHNRYGELDEKRAALKRSLIAHEHAEKNASMRVRQERRNYLTALASVEIAKRQVTMTKEALDLAQSVYEAGTGSSLEVTDARRTALSAELDLATKKLEAQIALLGLLYAIGEDMTTLGG